MKLKSQMELAHINGRFISKLNEYKVKHEYNVKLYFTINFVQVQNDVTCYFKMTESLY